MPRDGSAHKAERSRRSPRERRQKTASGMGLQGDDGHTTSEAVAASRRPPSVSTLVVCAVFSRSKYSLKRVIAFGGAPLKVGFFFRRPRRMKLEVIISNQMTQFGNAWCSKQGTRCSILVRNYGDLDLLVTSQGARAVKMDNDTSSRPH